MNIKRRNILSGVATLGLGATATTVVRAQEKSALPKVHWQCLVSWPKELEILLAGAQMIAQSVEQMSGGNFTIELIEDGKLDTDKDLLEAVGAGIVQCGHSASDYYGDKNSALNLFTGAPFGMTASENIAWLKYGGGLALANELYGKYNVMYLPAGNTGPQTGGWFNKEINKIDDLNGMKIRIGGMGGQALAKMGAVPTYVPFLNIADAIKSGEIDAAEFVGPYDDLLLGLDKVAKYYYAPGWWQLGDQLDFYINKDAYATLPPTYQAIVEAATYQANMMMLALYDNKNADALAQIQQDNKVELKQFPLEFLRAGVTIVDALHKENSKNNPDYQRVYDSWRKFAEKTSNWRHYISKTMINI